jgi:hypothetical protein
MFGPKFTPHYFKKKKKKKKRKRKRKTNGEDMKTLPCILLVGI